MDPRAAQAEQAARSGLGELPGDQSPDASHLLVVVAVLVAALFFRFTALEFVALVLCFAIVIAAELFNTAFEVLIDHA